jgi:serine/threonine-protein kinase OSR1/STK39
MKSSSINDTPPTLDREGGAHRYSRAFKDMIDSCLVKDPSKRYVLHDSLGTND